MKPALPNASSRRRRAVALMLAALVAGSLVYTLASAAAAALTRPGAAEPDQHHEHDAVPPPPASRDTVALVTAGIASPLASGSEIPIAGSLLATLTLGPGNARYGRELDVYLHEHQASPKAVDGATVQVTGRMRYMDHGTFRQIAVPVGGGHYLVSIDLPMPGEWDLELQIDAPTQRGVLRLNIDLYD